MADTSTTTYPIPSSNVDVLDLNAKNFDTFSNGPEETYIDRAGVERRTLPGVAADIAEINDTATASAAEAAASATAASIYAIEASESNESAGIHEANAAASASSAASSATSTGTALAQANAILGLGIGTSYISSDGDLIMTYDDGTVTVPPYINTDGEFIVEY